MQREFARHASRWGSVSAAAVLLLLGCGDPPGDPVLVIELVADNSRATDVTALGFSPQRVELVLSDTPTGTREVVTIPDSSGKTLTLAFDATHVARNTVTFFVPKAGFVHQIRFIEDGVTVIGPPPGATIARVPSGPQTGIKISPIDGIPFELQRNKTTHVEASFDVAHQINRPQGDGFHFKPSLQARLIQPPAPLNVTTDEVVVRFKNGTSDAAVEAAIRAFDPRTYSSLVLEPSLKLHLVVIPHDKALIDAINFFQARPEVSWATVHLVLPLAADNPRPANSPNDPLFTDGSQSYMSQVKAPAAWDRQIGSTEVIVAIIDSGIDLKHPDIVNNLFLNEGEIPADIRMRLQDADGDGRITFRDLNHSMNAGIVADSNGNSIIDGEDVLKPRGAGTAAGGLADGVDNDARTDEPTNVVDDLVGARFGLYPAVKVCQPDVCTPQMCAPAKCVDALGNPANGRCDNSSCTDRGHFCEPGACTGGTCTPGPCEPQENARDNKVDDDQTGTLNTNGHGTAVSGVVGAVSHNATNMTGMAWNVRILPIKMCDSKGNCTTPQIYTTALRYARRMGARVVNMSLGDTQRAKGSSQSQVNQMVLNPLKAAYDDGLAGGTESMLNVVVAGNGINLVGQNCDNADVVCVPAEVDMTNKVVVGGVDGADKKTGFSDFGPATLSIVAPAEGIMTLSRGQSTQTVRGTSFAAPQVAGAAALMLAQKPSLATDLTTLRNELISRGDPVSIEPGQTMVPRLNAGASVNAVASP